MECRVGIQKGGRKVRGGRNNRMTSLIINYMAKLPGIKLKARTCNYLSLK